MQRNSAKKMAKRILAGLLLCITLLALLITPAWAMAQDDTGQLPRAVDGRRVALVIGNSDYREESAWADLSNAANDARHIARLLGDSARGASRFEVTLITDGTMEEILEGLAAFAESAANADVSLVYYAGHGFEYGRENFIVPVDAPGQVSQYQIEQHFIGMEQIVGLAEARGFQMFFLDACRVRGPFVGRGSSGDAERAGYFGAIEAPRSVVFYATVLGEVAYDAAPPNEPLSPFASAVGRAISLPGLDIPYVLTSVTQDVREATDIYAPPQQPIFVGSWSRPFYFVPASAPASAGQSLALAQSHAQDTAYAMADGRTRSAGSDRRARQSPPAGPQLSGMTPPVPPGADEEDQPPRLDIPFSRLSTVDDDRIVLDVLERHSPEEVLAMAGHGDPVAQYLVGYMYEFGAGLPRDLDMARQWLELAAATEHPAGQLELGYFLQRHGSEAEREDALALLIAASDTGYAKAKSHLASTLLTGPSGERYAEEATRLYREAAELGHAYARYALSIRQDDPPTQIARLRALSESGNREGDRWLCELSQSSFAIDEAYRHCETAARDGYTIARAYTALMLDTGEGVERSPGMARYWARIATESFDLSEGLRARMATILGE
ncbi:caspase family protein [Parasphingopyxis marina]|uniref:Caspase family protein n=1 Tax=Parasphingopyxis marina TaxID=2761622 RepID=A0A842I042_9SPHN|nr:caspase family protein [Parasphingopyxis marina]MBC2778021.1 caspase family protein [Parasphingopyxis marina]